MAKKSGFQSGVGKVLKERAQAVYDLLGRAEGEVQKNLMDFIDKQTFIPPARRKQLKSAVQRLRPQDFADRAAKTGTEIRKHVEDGIQKALTALNIATKNELKALGKKLESLSHEIQSVKGKA